MCQISSPILACPRELIPSLLPLLTKSDMLLQHDNTVTTISPNVRLRDVTDGDDKESDAGMIRLDRKTSNSRSYAEGVGEVSFKTWAIGP